MFYVAARKDTQVELEKGTHTLVEITLTGSLYEHL